MPKLAETAAVPKLPNSLRVACDRRHLAALRDFVRGHLAQRHIGAPVAGLIEVAVDEVCANVMLHGNRDNSACSMTLTMVPPTADSARLVVEIRDHGVPFEPPPFAAPDLRRYVQERRKGGLGLALVYRIMDGVEFITTPDGTNLTRLTKDL